MSEANIRSIQNITGKTYTNNVPGNAPVSHDNPGTLLTNSDADKIYKINTIIVSSIGGGGSEVSVQVYNGSNSAYLIKEVYIPLGTAQVISTKETYFYLRENYEIRAARTLGGSMSMNASIIISYEIIS